MIVLFYACESATKLKNQLFERFDILNSILFILFTAFTFVLPFKIYKGIKKSYNAEKLEEEGTIDKYGIYYKDNRITTMHRALYTFYFIFRRLIIVITLLHLDWFPLL